MSLTADHHLSEKDWDGSGVHPRSVEIKPNPQSSQDLGHGPTYCVIHLGGVTQYILARDYAAAIRHHSEILSKLRAAHHKATKATNKRCAVNIGLIVSGGESYPNGEELAQAVTGVMEDSLAFKKALRGHNIDDIGIMVASLPKD